jgi:ABC-2 type transport system permease protein
VKWASRLGIINQVRAVVALIWFDGIIPKMRSPFDFVNFVVSPLTVLFFIYLFAGPGKAVFAMAGGLVAVIVGSCIILETEAAFIRLVVKLQDMFVASPISPFSYVVGLSVSQLFNGLLGIALFAGLLAFNRPIGFLGALEIVLAGIMTWSSVSALGFMMSTFARDVRDLWVYSPLLNVVLSFLPPVFYPISLIPEKVRFIAYLAPTTYPAQIIQRAAGLGSGDATSFSLYLVGGAAYSLALVFLAAKLSRWRQK